VTVKACASYPGSMTLAIATSRGYFDARRLLSIRIGEDFPPWDGWGVAAVLWEESHAPLPFCRLDSIILAMVRGGRLWAGGNRVPV
jgi:hypothetical protein